MRAFQFSEFEFEPLSGRLCRAGTPVPLRPQPAALLALLIKERHRVVGKQEILDTIWCDTYVQDQSLFQSIAELRKSLGDSAREPLYIKTVARRGYRWIHPSTSEVEITSPAALGSDHRSLEGGEPTDELPIPPLLGSADGRLRTEADEPMAFAFPELEQPSPRRWQASLRVVPMLLVAVVLLSAVLWGGARLMGEREPLLSRTVAILPFVNATGDAELDWVAYGLMDLVSRRLEDHQGLSIIGADQIARTEADLDDHAEAGRHGAWASGLRRAYGPLWVISARLEDSGSGNDLSGVGQYRLAYQLQEKDGPIAKQVLTGADPIALARTLADRVAATVVAPSLHAALPTVTADSFLDEVYAKGIHQLYRGGAKRAIPYFKVSLDHDPGFLLAKLQLAICYEKLADYPLSEQLTREVLEDERARNDPAVIGKALTNLGTLAFHRQDWESATKAYEQAVIELEATGDRRAQAWALGNLGNLAMVDDQLERSKQHLWQSVETFREIGDRIGEGNALGNLGLAAQRTGDLEEARRLYTESIDLRRQIGDRKGLGWALLALGQLEQQAGQLDAAAEHWNEALALQMELGDRLNAMRLLLSLGGVERWQHKLDEAAAHLEQARELAAQLEMPEGEADALCGLGAIALAQGDETAAERHFERAIERATAVGGSRVRISALDAITDAYLQQKRPSPAQRYLEHATEEELRSSQMRLIQAKIEFVEKRFDAAVQTLESIRESNPTFWTERLDQFLLEAQAKAGQQADRAASGSERGPSSETSAAPS